MTVEASGSGGRSSHARVTTSCSWSDDLNTDTALVVDVLNRVELQQDHGRGEHLRLSASIAVSRTTELI